MHSDLLLNILLPWKLFSSTSKMTTNTFAGTVVKSCSSMQRLLSLLLLGTLMIQDFGSRMPIPYRSAWNGWRAMDNIRSTVTSSSWTALSEGRSSPATCRRNGNGSRPSSKGCKAPSMGFPPPLFASQTSTLAVQALRWNPGLLLLIE